MRGGQDTICTVMWSCTSPPTSKGYKPNHFAILLDKTTPSNCSVSDSSNISISDSHLDIEDTNIEDTNIEDTHIEDTNLEDTNLEDTNLEDTKININ